MEYLWLYLVIINSYAMILVIYDKQQAIKHRQRISENHLLTIALLGGALFMYWSMKIWRHKTRHAKFMIGLPIIFVIHVLLYAWLVL